MARLTGILVLVVILVSGGPGMSATCAPSSDPSVVEFRSEVFDSERQRRIPVKIYRPAREGGLAPLVLFSHGLGSSREGYAYLGRYWASRGYIVVHLQHAGSDNTLGTRALYAAARAGDVDGNRPRDVSAVLDALEAGDRGKATSDPAFSSLRALIDFDRIAVAGHSFGAYTALACAGLLIDFPDQKDRSFEDKRIKAAIAISPPRMSGAPDVADYRRITVPLLHITGTRDRTVLLSTFPRHRRIPFDAIRGGHQYLITFRGATHASFSDEPERKTGDQTVHELTKLATVRFLDAYLGGDSAALTWLRTNSLGASAKIERRP